MRYLCRNRITKSGATDKSNDETPLEPFGTIQLTNRSSEILEYGDIVVLDKSQPLSVKTTNNYYNDDVIGVVKIGGTFNELITIQYAGMIEVKMNSARVRIGDHIYTSNIYKHGYASSSAYPGVFAKALSSKTNGITGLVKVLLCGGLPELY